MVWHHADDRRALAVLALSSRVGAQLVSDAGVAQRSSIDQARRLPLDSASDVCFHLAMGPCAGIAVAKLACWMGCARHLCRDVFCPRASRRTNDVRALRPGISRLHAADWTAACNRSEEHTSELQSRLHLVCRL